MSKTKLILEWLEAGKAITNWIAFREFGVTRLSSIIFNLRERGYLIFTEMEDGIDRWGNPVRYGVYRLDKEEDVG